MYHVHSFLTLYSFFFFAFVWCPIQNSAETLTTLIEIYVVFLSQFQASPVIVPLICPQLLRSRTFPRTSFIHRNRHHSNLHSIGTDRVVK
jgi:hypothetical protein